MIGMSCSNTSYFPCHIEARQLGHGLVRDHKIKGVATLLEYLYRFHRIGFRYHPVTKSLQQLPA